MLKYSTGERNSSFKFKFNKQNRKNMIQLWHISWSYTYILTINTILYINNPDLVQENVT